MFSEDLDKCDPNLDLADSVNRVRKEVFVWVYVLYIFVLEPLSRFPLRDLWLGSCVSS